MKSIAAIILALTLVLPVGARAHGGSSDYVVASGDTLWDIAASRLGSAWCWPLIATRLENEIDFRGTLNAGASVELPPRSECDDMLVPVTAETVRTQTVGFAFGYPWYENGITAGTYLDRRFGFDSGLSSYSRYDDMFDPNDLSLYRERDGGTWYVVSKGVRGQAWDYVDHVLRNDATGSVFYRARDIRGEWYLVKNEVATKLSFEPNEVYLLDAFDEVLGVRSEDGTVQAYSAFEAWTISEDDVLARAVDARGHVLFTSVAWEGVETVGSDGEPLTLRDSTVHSQRTDYWLDGTRVAESFGRMVPLFTSREVSVPLPFYFMKGTQKAFKYYGVFAEPSFDADGNIVLYGLLDSRILRITVDLP